MLRLILSLIVLACSNNIVEGQSGGEVDNRELIKQYGFCKCKIFLNQQANGRVDSPDYSLPWLSEMLGDYLPTGWRAVRPVIDSLTKKVFEKGVRSKYPKEPVAVAVCAYGKTSYSIDCLNFYKSKQLESIVNRFLPRN